MNAYLALTKFEGSLSGSALHEAISGKEKASFYEKVIREHKNYWTSAEFEEERLWYAQRFEQHYTKAANKLLTREFTLKAQASFVTGQGQPSVLGSHLALHKMYGVPYIPGTAIKGAAAHYCHSVLGKQDSKFCMDGVYYEVLFGSQDRAGFLHYHDALPTPQSIGQALKLDVLTPHHQNYNDISFKKQLSEKKQPSEPVEEINEGKAPRDDDSPVPVHFIAAKADFQVVLECADSEPSDMNWLEIAEKIVIQAIEQEGLGGKTNAGYGRYERVTEVNR